MQAYSTKLLSTLTALVLCTVSNNSLYAKDSDSCVIDTQQKLSLDQITVETNNIFDETAEDTIALHRWANQLHIITKPGVIEERLPFDKNDQISKKDIIEAEAILRSQRYLANAEITSVINCEEESVDLEVKTWDNWSLIPTFSFSRSGGQNSTIIGVREDNLLGLGIRSTFRYSDNEQRSGHQFAISSPLPWLRHSNLSMAVADNDDGEVFQIALNKPFYNLSTENSFIFSAEQRKQVDDIYQNDVIRNSLAIDRNQATVGYGWRLSSNNQQSTRISVGLTEENSNFSVAPESPTNNLALVPEARDFLFAWVGFEYLERNIEVMEDVFLINQPEDINLGWHVYAQLGYELMSNDSGQGIHSRVSARTGASFDDSLLLFGAYLNAVTNTDITDYTRFDTSLEYLHRSNDHLAYYGRLAATYSSGQYLDRPIVVDDANGIRGLPFQYQHGDHRVTARAEIRWYADYNVYQLFEVGFAGFVDAGRAYGGEQALLNIDTGTLASAGLGIRIYSNKASNTGVLHIDLARPFTDNPELDDWELSVKLRRSF